MLPPINWRLIALVSLTATFILNQGCIVSMLKGEQRCNYRVISTCEP